MKPQASFKAQHVTDNYEHVVNGHEDLPLPPAGLQSFAPAPERTTEQRSPWFYFPRRPTTFTITDLRSEHLPVAARRSPRPAMSNSDLSRTLTAAVVEHRNLKSPVGTRK